MPSEVQTIMPSGQAVMSFANASHAKSENNGKPLCQLEEQNTLLPLGKTVMFVANASHQKQLMIINHYIKRGANRNAT